MVFLVVDTAFYIVLKWVTPSNKLNLDFESLPAEYQNSFIEKSNALGVNASSKAMRRAAVKEYQDTILKAQQEAEMLGEQTVKMSTDSLPRRI